MNSPKINIEGYLLNRVIKTGMILLFGGSTAPEGFLLCTGGAISRSTYSKLFSVIGTIYGAGDGSTTFNIPNFNYKSVWQDPNNLGVTTNGSVPNITGSNVFGLTNANGSFRHIGSSGYYAYDHGGTFPIVNFDASRSSGIYTNGQTQVVPAAVVINFLIKY